MRIFGILVVFWSAASASSFWTDSEIWPTVVVRYLGSSSEPYNFAIKPLFNLLLWPAFQLSQMWDRHPMEILRPAFLLNSLVCAGLFFALCRRMAGAALWAVLLTVAWCGHSYFVKRFGQVRSDALVTTVVLAGMWLAWTKPWGRSLGVITALTAVCTLLTPKGALFAVPWLLITRPPARRGLILLAVASIAALTIGALWALDWPALAFFEASFTREGVGLSYWDLGRWIYVFRWLKENPHFVFFLGLNFWMGWRWRLTLSEQERWMVDYANVMALLLLLYPDRLPFFIAAISPFFVLPSAAALARRPLRRPLVLALASIGVLLGSSWAAITMAWHNSDEQRTYVRWLNGLADELGDASVVDPVGVIYKFAVWNWFLGPAETKSNEIFLERVRTHWPDFILPSPRLAYGGPELDSFLLKHYAADETGVLRRQIRLLPQTKKVYRVEIENLLTPTSQSVGERSWSRVYQMLALDGQGRRTLTNQCWWGSKSGTPIWATGEFTRRDLEQFDTLNLGSGVEQVLIWPKSWPRPVEDAPPFRELFRFDIEY